MSIKTDITIEDLYRILEDGKAEIVDGEIVLMPPAGDFHSGASLLIAASLLAHARRTGVGRAYADNAGFIVNLPHRKSFSPDAAFYIGPPTGMDFIEGSPVFAVEIRSKNDYGPQAERQIIRKRADYFAAGTRVVWDVDLLSDAVVRVYRATAPSNPTVYRRGEIAEAEPAVPGWRMPVDELFA